MQDLIELWEALGCLWYLRKSRLQGANWVRCVCNLDGVIDIGYDSPPVRACKPGVGGQVWKQVVGARSLDDGPINDVPITCHDNLAANTVGVRRPKSVNVRLTSGGRERYIGICCGCYRIDKRLYAYSFSQ
jgi:hypothetical protein